VVDVSHGVPPQDVLAGALVLRQAVPWFPSRTVHVAVVDPGVGSDRRALCVETDRALLVGPDNGLLSLAAPPAAIRRIVELTEERFFLSPRSRTFHGRDVFAPVAAALATGTDPGALGPRRDDLVRLALPEPSRHGDVLRGEVVYVDRFGNLVTNVPPDAFPSAVASITIAGARVAGVSACSSRSTSSVQPVRPNVNSTQVTSAPRIFGISTRFGQSGVTATTRSPGPTSAWVASMSADMPEFVTAMWPASTGQCSRDT
jgi:S-adenosylmethionine hydrolase